MIDFWHIFGVVVFIAGCLDSYKYRILTNKIRQLKTSRGHSRMFANIAIFHKICLLIWACLYLHDWVVAASTSVALYTSCELWWTIKIYYPFKNCHSANFKTPSLWRYFVTSFLPNNDRNRL